MAEDAAASGIGTDVAGYRLERVLGRGGMSVVYLAQHRQLRRKVALKVLAPGLSADESYRERFMRESRRAAELDHPNVIPIYDAGEENGQLYIAMRYVEGCDLNQLIRRQGSIPLGRALFILEQVASALDFAHERDLIHRDVKPSNILVAEPADRVYLTDFGVVKHTSSRGLTETGFFVGTVDYASPEQIEGLAVDATTDVYALGCVFFECMTGRAPFNRDGEVAVLHAHLTEAPPALTAERPDLPKTLNFVVATAMAKPRYDRFPSCEAFVAAARNAALQRVTTPRAEAPAEIAVATESTVPTSPTVAAGRTERSRRGAWSSRWVLGGVLLAACAAPAAVFALHLAGGKQPAGRKPPTAVHGTTTVAMSAVMPGAAFDRECRVAPTRSVPGATQSFVCTRSGPTGTGSSSSLPAGLEVSIFPNQRWLRAAYDALRAQNDIGTDFGTCGAATWAGEGSWQEERGRVQGRRFCYFDGNVAVVVWTHDEVLGTRKLDVLGIARENGGGQRERLFRWWERWHGTIGTDR